MIRDFLVELSSRARSAISAALAGDLEVSNKDAHGFDPVTAADRAAEQVLRSAIEQHYPRDGIWGEEFGWTREGAERVWSLDPVDGTRALICGLPSWSVLVGLVEDGRHVAGMIDLPALGERLIAADGFTERNGERVQASGCVRLAEARLATTDPFLFAATEREAFERVRAGVRVTRFGLDALAYARVATGDIDLVIESGLKRHDYDALVAVVRGAGGIIGDWQGRETLTEGKVAAAATRALYDEAVELLAGA